MNDEDKTNKQFKIETKKALLGHTGVAIVHVDAQGNFLRANNTFVEFIGYTWDELKNMNAKDITHPEYIEQTRDLIAKQINGEIDQFTQEKYYIRKDGALRWGEMRSTPIRDEQGRLVSAVVAIINRTKRKQAEEALAENEALYRNLFENAPIGMFQATFDGVRFLRVNSAYATMLGYESPEELLSTVTDISALHVRLEDRSALLATLKQQDWFYGEFPRFRKDGSIMIGKVAIRRVLKPDGTMAYMEGVVEDMTERRRAEVALKKRERELQEKTKTLEEMNTTLKVLLKSMEKDQEDLKERFLANIREQVMPTLDNLKKTPLNDVQKGFIEITESYLDEIASPFVQSLTSSYLNLTKKEITIASLIKEGKTSKEIAELVNVSKRDIDFHRGKVREKLGLKNQKGNLQILLRTFS